MDYKKELLLAEDNANYWYRKSVEKLEKYGKKSKMYAKYQQSFQYWYEKWQNLRSK